MDAEDFCRRGAMLHQKGDLAGAESIYRDVLARDSGQATALRLLGVLRSQQGRKTEAEELMRAALTRQPSAPGFLHYGLLLVELERHEAALENFGRALALSPGLGAAHYNRGNALGALGRPGEALAAYDAALAIEPDDAPALNNRAGVLHRLGRADSALADYTRAAALMPGDPQPLHNRANLLRELKRPQEAVEAFEQLLAMVPDSAAAWDDCGAVFWDMMRTGEALACFANAIQADPDYAPARFHRALTLLALGRLEEGWPLLEWRTRLPSARRPLSAAGRVWSGKEELAGRSLLIWWEEGFGDVMMLARYAGLAAARGAQVTFQAPAPLQRLMAGLQADVRIIGGDAVPPHFDFQIPMFSLPLAFGTQMDSIPAPPAYFAAEPERVARWADRIGRHGFRIGVVWAATTSRALGRSFPLAALEGIARLPGVRLISLQKVDGLEELDSLPPGMMVERLEGFDEDGAFLDTAAIMENLDLVIAADTAPAHLAGGLGRPLWLALKFAADWRWFIGRSDSPWYPHARLFRQASDGDWQSVFAAMQAQLAKRK